MAATALRTPMANLPDPDLTSVVRLLETARGSIEERFLDGGNAILAILDVLNGLVGSLDELTTSLDADTAQQTTAELEKTGKRLTELTDVELGRQDSFRSILAAQQALRPQVAQMQETLRYLRTFAVTAKITGAGIPEFAGFAEEILQRIGDGRVQVDDLSCKLGKLGAGLAPVIERGEAILVTYQNSIPAIISNLSEGGEKIAHHRSLHAAHAASVKAVTARIQAKLGATLSAMQIGDATRQRIEHCQSAIAILEEASYLPEDDRQLLDAAIRQLVYLQIEQTSADFARETRKIVETVASFRSDLQEIASLRGLMNEGGETDDATPLRLLEQAISEARAAVREVEAVAQEAAQISRGTAETVAELTHGIGVVQMVRTDIHYMALNTNLRCSRVGEDGKAINVVAAELRNFAAQLDESAEKILGALQSLEAAATTLRASDADADTSLDSRLEAARAAISHAAEKMAAGLRRLTQDSATAEEQTMTHLGRLDFDGALGNILHSCAEQMSGASAGPIFVGDREPLREIGNRILKLYTMAPERELHAQIFGASVAQTSAPPGNASGVQDDDDLLDALF
ncbi:methyl-accepting chemotaxis protein [Pseudorhizobium tarimense]|uniref:Methyl-accepting chemotaxis protein n=1 Tax=Pseudorhizobium tarimense TaxID=1079109 RepID=A0ABV2H8J8_9HYPH|nr:methyl-accepting chemotaxis protein [Pseudorhizobium tarimense]MCJ8519996.1 methyl-accepting chemotaxis protein [Pseudorhizobium tarimense]